MSPQESAATVPSGTPGRRVTGWATRGAVALGLLGFGIAGFFLLSREPAKPKPSVGKPPPVRTRVITLRTQEFPVAVRSQGIVRARDEVTLSAQIASRVARVGADFEDGAFFEAGDVLVELDSEDFRTAVAMAEARVQSTEAAAKLADINQRRDSELLQNHLLPAAQAEVSVATLAQARAEAATAAAQLERARRDLDRTRVRAPFAGCVRRRAVGLGQWVTPGTPLGTVFAVDAVEIRLPVSGVGLELLNLPGERAATNSKREKEPPMEVMLQSSLATTSAIRWRGRVIRGEQALDGDTLERFVIVRVDDPFGLASGLPPLRPGQPVTAFLPGQVLSNVLVIPRAAVWELDRILLVDPTTMRLSSRRILPIWADEHSVVVSADAIPAGHHVATTRLVYSPEGTRVEIIPDIPGGVVVTNDVVRATNAPTSTAQTP